MTLIRRLRGLVGTALIWGAIGAVMGVGAFVAVFRPWPLNAETLPRVLQLFIKWEAASVLWGIATGLTFGLVILALERTRRWSELTPSRLTAWGAVAGALFPALLSIRPLMSGASPVYFGLIIGGSALAGALWARASFALARRLPSGSESGMLSGPPADGVVTHAAAGDARIGVR
jgi:hypothetical protein